MRISRPRTLLGLILLGLSLVTLPLLLAVANAALELGQLTTESEAFVSESATATQENQRVAGLLTDMERNARQYLLLQDRELLDIYADDQQTLEQSLALLADLSQNTVTVTELERLRAASLAVHAALAETPAESIEDDVVNSFEIMSSSARAVSQDIRLVINSRLADLQEGTRTAQSSLAWQAAALVPAALALIVFFALLVGRPIRQIDRAIRELGEGNFEHAIAVTGPRDIEALGKQLEWLRSRLMESAEEKNKFLRHISHELKTPLANIREGTDLLLDGAVGELDMAQQEVTDILRDNGIKLQKLIENLLTFSAWQTKTATMKLSEFELKPLIFDVLSLHRLAISKKKIKLQLDASPVLVHADEEKLRIVLENLISNAINFTPYGGIINVGARLTEDVLFIDVADSGPGVAEEDCERIFEAFYQGRRSQKGLVGGSGIGLSVVAECVQAHGGTVKLVSEKQSSGAHFQVQLPLNRPRPEYAMAANA